MDGLPFGYTHRQKRSHAQMQASERSVSPAWTFDHFAHPRESAAFNPTRSLYNHADRHTPSAEPSQQRAPLYPPADPRIFFTSQESSSTNASSQTHRVEQRNPHVEEMPAAAPRRFAGDGLDFRRPMSSSTRRRDAASVDLTAEDDDDDDDDNAAAIDLSGHDQVIDLTADDSGYGASQEDGGARQSQRAPPSRRLPRGMDIIIDLDNGEEEWTLASPAPEPGSPEIEFISSRTLNRPRESAAPGSNGLDADEVEFVEARPLPDAEIRRRMLSDLTFVDMFDGHLNNLHHHVARIAADINLTNANMNRAGGRHHRGPIAPPRGPPRAHAHVRVGAFAVPNMDFNMVGFDMGMGGARAPDPPPPTYEAPSKAAEGFTRSPEEEDVLVCPNCSDELCASEDELKSQVWIVKACGHVYCGECTANRALKRSSKGKERSSNTAPFKTCVVQDCGKNVSHKKAMIQVFL